MGFSADTWRPRPVEVIDFGIPLESEGPPETARLNGLRISTHEIVRRLTDLPIVHDPRPQVSPDGRRGVYLEGFGSEQRILYPLSSLVAEPEILVHEAGSHHGYQDFQWARESRHIVYTLFHGPLAAPLQRTRTDTIRGPRRC